MPAGGNQAIPLANSVFAEGYLTATLPGGTPDGVVVGYVTDVTYSNKWTKKEQPIPGSKMAGGVGYSGREVSIKAKHASFTAQGMVIMAGATLTNSGGNTVASSYGNDQPPPIKLTLKSPSDGSDITMAFGKVLADMDEWSIRLHEYSDDSMEFTAYPDPASTPTADLVWQMTFPGIQSAS